MLTNCETVLNSFIMKEKIYNIPLSCSFVDVLAQKFLDEFAQNPLDLPDVLFLLPNRRAAKALRDAFVRIKGLSPTLLPRMMPLGDVEEDELFLTGGEGKDFLAQMQPAIGTTERLLLFTRIIMAKPNEFGMERMSLAQACYLAQELAGLIDMAHNQKLSFAKLENLVPDEYAVHWQDTLKFLKIITQYWPDILQERNLIDASLRRNLLLEAQSEIWEKNRPRRRIVAAGTTAAFPAMKKLIKTVLSLENGEVYLSGVDKSLEQEAWDEIDETHPQYELKDLLDYLDMPRELIADVALPDNKSRELLVSEIMRPAKVTDKWLEIQNKQLNAEAWAEINLINCADIREEALAIALIMRETLEYESRTAALVTSDRNLARRVATELERWDILVDDSAGKPLSLTPIGIFLRLAAKAGGQELNRVEILGLLKHPLLRAGMDTAELRKKVRALEKKVWRSEEDDEELQQFLADILNVIAPYGSLMKKNKGSFKELLQQHIAVAEKLATTPEQSGEQILWRGDDGEAAAKFIADLYDKAEVLGEIETSEYLGLLEAMMASVTVRPRFGAHPRLKILGPIEARLNRFDVTIIGEVNEGVWPKLASADPWMSRPMKKEFGFALPEKAIGVMGFDFSQQLAGGEVYLTRAERVQGTPMVKSRWWMRLETVLKALKLDIGKSENQVYRSWAKALDEPRQSVRINPPAPRPPLYARPHKLSASAIEMWMRDPYAIFAKYILGLKPLDELNKDITMADYGTIIHKILQEFNDKYPAALPANSREELIKLGQAYFEENEIAQETRAFWWPNFEKTVDWFLEQEKTYRPEIAKVHNEVKGEMVLKTAGTDFTVTAIADRVDITKGGKINIIDYKTGRARKEKEVRSGKAPQLPIEGLIARSCGFDGLSAGEVEKLIYWQLGRQETIISDEIAQILDDNLANLQKYINFYEFESTPYVCQPNPKNIPEYSDYEHLARIKEWSLQESGDDD